MGQEPTDVFDLKEEDTFWCSADIGWITGHSYSIYGALLNGTTTLEDFSVLARLRANE
jgi:acyl-coenzyme A synthetase/AMP-(fatty) acid ligase